MTDHTCTEKIDGDSIYFCGHPSRAGNRYDSLATPLGTIESQTNIESYVVFHVVSQVSLHESLHRPPFLPLASLASRTTPPLHTRKAVHLQPTQSHPRLMYIRCTLHEKKGKKGKAVAGL